MTENNSTTLAGIKVFTMEKQKKKELIAEYYRRVDAQDIDWVLALFTWDARYVRADTEYSTKMEIEKFYCNDRKIVGRHMLNHVIAEGNEIGASGIFQGVGADGAEKSVGFMDLWVLRGNKASYRQTYLSLGSSYIKD